MEFITVRQQRCRTRSWPKIRREVRPIAIPNWEIYDSAKGIGSSYKIVVVCNNAVAANPPPVWVPPESGTNLLQSAPRASKIFTTLPPLPAWSALCPFAFARPAEPANWSGCNRFSRINRAALSSPDNAAHLHRIENWPFLIPWRSRRR